MDELTPTDYKNIWRASKKAAKELRDNHANSENPVPEVKFSELQKIKYNELTNLTQHATIILVTSVDMLTIARDCVAKGYYTATVVSSNVYITGDINSGNLTSIGKVFIGSNAHESVQYHYDQTPLSKEKSYIINDIMCFRDDQLKLTSNLFLYNAIVYIHSIRDIEMTPSSKRMKSDDLLKERRKIRSIFVNAIARGFDALILDTFFNGRVDYPYDSYIEIINECIKLYGSHFKLIVVCPKEAFRAKFQNRILKKAPLKPKGSNSKSKSKLKSKTSGPKSKTKSKIKTSNSKSLGSYQTDSSGLKSIGDYMNGQTDDISDSSSDVGVDDIDIDGDFNIEEISLEADVQQEESIEIDDFDVDNDIQIESSSDEGGIETDNSIDNDVCELDDIEDSDDDIENIGNDIESDDIDFNKELEMELNEAPKQKSNLSKRKSKHTKKSKK